MAAVATACVGSVALAQTREQHLLGRTHHSGQHSCSQSWATSSEDASFTVDIRTQHRATITIDRSSRSTTGSQPMFGDDNTSPPTVIQEHTQVTLEGTAQPSTQALDFDMTEMTLATARWQGEGTLPLGAPTTRTVALHVHCEASAMPVYEATDSETLEPAEGAPSRETTVYVCQFTDPPSAGWNAFLAEYGEHAFPLAEASLIRVTSDGPFRHAPFYRFQQAR